ncbi:MAG: oligosaccharide flippase family protein [Clostridia bacterium]|nr:oligosaccharide flippase family protein [Clostridia bacterium]
MSCLERALGFGYRVFLSRNVGSEGLGLYQIALSVIGVLITLSASGVPITVSRLMIKERAANRVKAENQTVTAGIITALATCLPICIFFFVCKNSLNYVFADSRCNILFLIILPGVVLTSVYAVIRGFFWGTKSFYTYSLIELAEEAIMIICGVFLVLKGKSLMEKAVYACVAVLLSYVFSFVVSSVVFVAKGGRISNPSDQLKPLLSASVPITFMKTSNSLTSSLIALIFPAMLIAGGVDSQTAISQFGVISGMTIPLLFIPSTLIGSVSLVLSPEISENYYKKNARLITDTVEKALLYALAICMLIVPTFSGTGEYIGVLIYDNPLSGIYLRDSALIMIPMSISMITTSLLNSMGFEKRTLIYYLLGAATLLACIIFLPKYVGNYALIFGYLISFTVSAFLNVKLLAKTCNKKLSFYKKFAICSPILIGACFFNYFLFGILKRFILNFFAMAFACAVTVALTVFLLCVFSVINIKNLKKIGL